MTDRPGTRTAEDKVPQTGTKGTVAHWPAVLGGHPSAEGSAGRTEVRSPWDGALLATVPACGPEEVDEAVALAVRARRRDDFPQHARALVLDRAAALLRDRGEQAARTIAHEAAKPLVQARAEAARAVDTLTWAAVEARRLAGEVVPLSAAEAGAGKTAFTLRVPVGVVAAVSPFNFPLNLVAHKLAPAIAAGCPVVLKPAGQTPLSALLLADVLREAGLPDGWLSVLPGGGTEVGEPLVTHPDVAYVTFTGSTAVGWGMVERSPRKRVRLELGSSSPLVVDETGDWETAAAKTAVGGYSHAGQSCISTQRVYVHTDVYDDYLAALVPAVEALVLGDPLDEDVRVSSLISTRERDRVHDWIGEAVDGGARLLCGGELRGTLLTPAVLADPDPAARVQAEEVFGPVVTVSRISSYDEGLALANDSRYGLQAGVFTARLDRAMQAARQLEFSGVLVNDVPTSRVDLQPYGGGKDSGNTREGPRYAVEEMTEHRLVVLPG